MTIEISHETLYKFSHEVYLAPHKLRLCPQTITNQLPVSFDLNISPMPAGLRNMRDEENNSMHVAWFTDQTDRLTITAITRLNIPEYNPFNFIVYPVFDGKLSALYSESSLLSLAPAMKAVPLKLELIKYGEEIWEKSNSQMAIFLTDLTAQIHKDFTTIHREEGEPYAPDHTFVLRQGSCRDLAWMQIHLLRNMGFAARFVSGYYYIDIDNFELHAWTEVFVPGAGWLGFDPSYGIPANSTHFNIASSVHYERTMPVTGIYYGKATSSLKSNITMRPVKYL